MESKSFPVAEVKTAKGAKGEFEALVSVFGNIDIVADRVAKGAFAKAIKEQPPPPVVWSHQWQEPPVGETLSWTETSDGLVVKSRLFVGEDDDHPTARAVYTAMKSGALREFSFAYDIEEAEHLEVEGMKVRELRSIFPVHEVGPCLRGVNTETRLLTAPKGQQLYLPVVTTATGGFDVTYTAKVGEATEPITRAVDVTRRIRLMELGVNTRRL